MQVDILGFSGIKRQGSVASKTTRSYVRRTRAKGLY